MTVAHLRNRKMLDIRAKMKRRMSGKRACERGKLDHRAGSRRKCCPAVGGSKMLAFFSKSNGQPLEALRREMA